MSPRKPSRQPKRVPPVPAIPHVLEDRVALGLEIEPEDVAGIVVWLASDAARTITGQVIVCDAGQVFVR